MDDIATSLKRELTELRDTALEVGLGVLSDFKEAGQFINTGTEDEPNFTHASPALLKRNPGQAVTLYYLKLK